jgi:16S rRNA (uracil1498-N3)-methyltransferase
MRLHRFYTKVELTSSLTYAEQSHIHQWKNVFRYEMGDSVILFGDGFEHTYTIESIHKKETVLREQSKTISRLQESELTLAIALIKRDNFELVLQKCTEIGVTAFVPLITDRSLQKMFGVDRLEKILIEATEQSGWGSVPILKGPTTITDILEKSPCIVFDMTGIKADIEKIKNLADSKTILIGPEGGFTDTELKLSRDNKSNILSLGVSTLRAETAAILIAGIIGL